MALGARVLLAPLVFLAALALVGVVAGVAAGVAVSAGVVDLALFPERFEVDFLTGVAGAGAGVGVSTVSVVVSEVDALANSAITRARSVW